ncbi:MAG: hypothetical protein K9N23_04560, partial [Akkermansiaceae bacterium]|nr:hypothetical protein [Akkermansiaceae bacterium]
MNLIILHSEADGSLSKLSLETLSATIALGAPFTVGLIGENPGPAADSIASCGAAKFLTITGSEYGQARHATDAAAA